MIRVHAGRRRPANRLPTPSDKTPTAQSVTYTAPIAGLVTNAPLASSQPGSALVLDNFWPTRTGIEPRGGTKLRCTIPGPVEALFQYRAGVTPTWFAADQGNIYRFSDSTPDGTELGAELSGQSHGDYSHLEMQTEGGIFLTLVNGADPALIYDGSGWQSVTDVSAPFSITGIETHRLAHIWAYRNRTFFLEKDSMDAWYLGVNSVAGAATRLPLSGVFNKGGSLLFGATWSSDSGAGLDDRCVFATDQGEFAIYSGANPSDINDWRLEGVYDIGEPLGKNSHIQIGGELIIATRAGLIPISAAIQKDVSALDLQALSRPIEPDWQYATVLAGNALGWQIVKWASRNMVLVAPPCQSRERGYCWAIHAETGAWARFTGWCVDTMAVLADRLHYGDHQGHIYVCDTGGTDNGQVFECRTCFGFDDLSAPGRLKTVHTIRGTWKYDVPIAPRHTTAKDYRPEFTASPGAAEGPAALEGVWAISQWDEPFWAAERTTSRIQARWESISQHGRVIAPQVQLLSAGDSKIACELISIDLTFSIAQALI